MFLTLSKAYCDEHGYDEDTFKNFVKQKIEMPFEMATSVRRLEEQTQPPPPEAFKSALRNKQSADPTQYANFINFWSKFNIQNLLQMFLIYNVADTGEKTIYNINPMILHETRGLPHPPSPAGTY